MVICFLSRSVRVKLQCGKHKYVNYYKLTLIQRLRKHTHARDDYCYKFGMNVLAVYFASGEMKQKKKEKPPII